MLVDGCDDTTMARREGLNAATFDANRATTTATNSLRNKVDMAYLSLNLWSYCLVAGSDDEMNLTR